MLVAPDADSARLIAGAAGCSPYLAGLITHEADWLSGALDDPEAAFTRILDQLLDVALEALPAQLREAKRRVALIVALADLAGAWPLQQVTQALTDFADRAVQVCLQRLVAAEVGRGKLPGNEADTADACGMVVLAMGKMGAGELNYSSDIDLICLFDETRFDPADYHEVRAAFIRVARKMMTIMSDVSAGGYVFRTDLRLRPDASVTPVCLSMEAAERYYESVGRTWERAAYIKARPCAGDIAAGDRFLETLRPFVWRKHLDFAAIQDAHDMRLRIRDHKGFFGPVVLDGHNMKLGRGGIREIEFFTQTRQLIAGGRDPTLRVRGTEPGLQRLAQADWVPHEVAQTLCEHYRFHREVEHRLQMINDAQTHDLPKDVAGFERLAAFWDRDAAQLREELLTRLNEVHSLTEDFFAPAASPSSHAQDDWGAEVTQRWHSYPALRSSRATEIFDRLTPQIMAQLQEAARPDEALAQFDGFLAGLPAGVQLFSLFEANPQLTQLIVDIAATAPALAQYLSRNAGVLDAVIGGAFFAPWPSRDALVKDLSEVVSAAPDYEAQLIAARRWSKEWHFRVGVHQLRGLINAAQSGEQYAALADAVLTALWPAIVEEFARKHGALPGRGAVVLGMGSLGAGRLTATSDLDLIVIYDAAGVEASDGRRPLPARTYYARLTQALVTALSAPMSEGRIYEVDMRLRPSGRQGPVATSLDAFMTYQRDEAWTWEHLALTRARPVAGNLQIGAGIESFRARLLAQKGKGPNVLAEVADMRRRIASAKNAGNLWDAKIGAGHLQDIELFAQTCALRGGSTARDPLAQLAVGGWLDAAEAEILGNAFRLFASVQSAARLISDDVFVPDAIGEGGRRFLLRQTGFDRMEALETTLRDIAGASDRVITAKLEGN